ncbi:hypothetical protein [Labrys sp. ZIDIC5]|uniref:hypothetical protein n=1 Tax=Labrys sedimenti TaxID=3106036 RepID=UPI002ACA8F65|nr:hypothetical protein [Labrys sp. ZIDIC5]MDZ5453626.1 hypothetical protein [Labrys sp. ZIDIC5]
MKIADTAKRISIIHEAYNPYYVELFDLVFKLSYTFEDIEKPRLEIFLNDSEAKDKEWKIYGSTLDNSDDKFANVRFELF